MTECQGCGAWNERHRALCVLCGTALAEADEWDATAELPPLPPLPDGGLSQTMPAWLREAPANPVPHVMTTPETDGDAPGVVPVLADEHAARVANPDEDATPHDAASNMEAIPPALDVSHPEAPLGAQADPRTFLRDEDFPRWVRELPTLPPRPLLPTPPQDAAPPATPPDDAVPAPVANPVPSITGTTETPETDPAAAPPTNQEEPQAAPPVALPPDPAHPAPIVPPRSRAAWELPLLILLGAGVVAAVLWALVANGLIATGM